MKRYLLSGITVLALVTMVTIVFAGFRRSNEVSVQFNTKDLPEQGVLIITPADSNFENIAADHFKSNAPENLKPLSVFIKNSGSKLVLAYALSWEFNDKNGQVISTKAVGYSEPGVLMGNKIPKDLKHTTAIEPNGVRCFSRDSKIDVNEGEANLGQNNMRASITSKSKLVEDLSRATNVTVTLDGVLFDDGSFVGPNKSHFFEQMQAMLDAKVDLLRELAEANQRGDVKQTFDFITQLSREKDIQFNAAFSADDWYRYFRKLYATEITDQYYAFGKDTLLPTLLESYKRARPKLRRQ